MLRKILLAFFLFTTVCLSCFSLEPLSFKGFIADTANVISSENEAGLNAVLLDLQNKTGADIAVVTLKSLQGRPIEDVSLEIVRKYRLGDKKLNNGALILVSLGDREARIEVGYGLEGYITDAGAGRILDIYMIPDFRSGNYEKGVIDGTLALAFKIADAYGVTLSAKRPVAPEQNDIDFWIILIFILIMMTSRWPFGGGFGGFGGRGGGGSGITFGGGGGFGGGGASRRW